MSTLIQTARPENYIISGDDTVVKNKKKIDANISPEVLYFRVMDAKRFLLPKIRLSHTEMLGP